MELSKISEFMEFSKTMNFTAAARKLHLSQPALSKHIQDIEGELSLTLVRRGVAGAPNELTPVGRRFLELAADLLRDYDSMVEELRELDAALPPARIQDVHHGFNVTSQLRARLEAVGLDSGNFAYTKIDLPICDALDCGMVDFAVHLEPSPHMSVFACPELQEIYGWADLKPEPLCFLAGAQHPLFGQETIDLQTLATCEVVSAASPAYESWYQAMPAIFLRHGFLLSLKAMPDSPLEGGAFPLGSRRLGLCTERFAGYYRDLDAETTSILRLREFEPLVYPFVVYRRDTEAPMARVIIEALSKKSGSEPAN